MATTNSVDVQHKQFRILRRPSKRYQNPKDREVISTNTVIVSNEAVIGYSPTDDVQRDPSWGKLPLSLVVKKLRSSEHHIVLRAVDELRARGCLSDNTLSWICLRYANLRGANLSAANLKNTDLHKANLELADLSYAYLRNAKLAKARMQSTNLDEATLDGANLVGANLRGAKNVNNEQLSRVSRLRGSILPDGNFYDGRFNLPGDFADASILHVDLNSPTAIAAFYGVSLEDFLLGQEWRQMHMSSISTWHESVCFQNAELIMNWL
jgi:uncharacterized protein YjbI with pentapeptide repeats